MTKTNPNPQADWGRTKQKQKSKTKNTMINTTAKLNNLKTQHGTIRHNGIDLVLTQQAYLDNNGNKDYYTALAVDQATLAMYSVCWDITNMDSEDESDACDWGDYSVTDLNDKWQG